MMREREVKMIVPESFELPDLHDAVRGASLGDVEERQIDDTYYDTPDLRIARWGCTLRYRDGDGWTVKIPRPSKGIVLDRQEATFSGDPGVPPARALNLVSSLTRGVDVEEVARLQTRRLVRQWLTDDGVLVMELADDEVRGSRTDGGEVEFREIEVELAHDAKRRLLDEIVERLTAARRAAERPIPKLVRVLGPAAQKPPDVDVTPLPSKPTAQEVIQFAFASSVARLLLHLPAARIGTDPEGVHQARVASRRMRSDLKTFEPLLDADWAAGLGADLRWVIDELGAVRDSDMLDLKLREVIARHPEIDDDAGGRVLDEIELKRRQDRRNLLRHLSNERAMQLFDDLVAASAGPETNSRAERPAGNVMPKLVRKRWKRLDRAIERLSSPPRAEELHAVRILAKRLRYAAEAVEPAVGKQAKKFAKDAARIQDVLGDLNDATVTGVLLTALVERLDGPAAFAAGQMAQQVAVDVRTHDKKWRAAHKRMTRRTAWFS